MLLIYKCFRAIFLSVKENLDIYSSASYKHYISGTSGAISLKCLNIANYQIY